MPFLPVNASNKIIEKYSRYLKTIFGINDNLYAQQFAKALSDEKAFAKGPYLDITDSFVKGRSIQELIKEGILSQGFEKINIPLTRPLYKHQEEGILKVLSGKNTVVSTGTGSGKTETFLIPVLNHLLREGERGQLNPGVRALIIYPMNALANDQVERLRGLLKDTDITFGCYTGQTKEYYIDALEEYKELNYGKAPIKNELISREQMKKTPPHILITNYAMLEYLMIRPADNVFFDGEYANNWQFIILDEAHVYRGSTGIEVSMLLRRLKAKINKDLRYILTSATLGGEGDNQEVAEFAQDLCNSPFDKDDVIRAKRIKIQKDNNYWDIPKDFYNEIVDLLNNGQEEGIIKDYITKKIGIKSSGKIEEILYDLVIKDKNYWKLKSYVDEPKMISDIARHLNWTEGDVQNFITIAAKCEKNSERLLDARYHMFLKATDSVFITLKPSSKLFLERKLKHYEGDKEYTVFEIGTCSYCHCIYLLGKQNEEDYLVQSSFINDEMGYVFILSDTISNDDEDHLLEHENIEYEEYNLCAICGKLNRKGAQREFCCEHQPENYIKVYKIIIKNESKKLTKCPKCENTNYNGIIRMFYTGQEAVTSVIGTALFEELPSYFTKKEIIEIEDDTGFGLSRVTEEETKINLAKQFIAFSDNRQGAAFYSTYLNQTYQNILYKRLIIETLKNKTYSTRGKSFNSFVEELISYFEKYNVTDKDQDSTEKEAWKAALLELVDNRGVTSLSSLGLIGISLKTEKERPNQKFNLSSEDTNTIISVMALGMMADCALQYDAILNKSEKEYFTYNGIEWSYTLTDSDYKKYRKRFSPQKYNKYLDYLFKVLKKGGNNVTIEDSKNLLEKGMWNILQDEFLTKSENGYKINSKKIIISKPTNWYLCSKCKRITIHNAFNVCPSFKCDGELIEINVEEHLKNNHYYNIYNQLEIRKLRVVEHTAQLSRDKAYEFQNKFKNKEIDVLSCSTTFEMGVDVGTLETVFMRNMPPSPSNYAQRAGRAGRSKNTCAYAITFCNKSSHDFTFFNTPKEMIKGRISPPKFKVENEKIGIRHLYAAALGFFWKKFSQYFADASRMNEGVGYDKSGYQTFYEYLNTHPQDLKDYLKKFLPKNLITRFEVEDFSWIPRLFNEKQGKEGLLTKAKLEYDYEVNSLKEVIDENIKENKKVDNLLERKKVYEKEDILSYLSRKNILPKYGFPVDTVELTVSGKGSNKLGLELQRDLSIAISEYAPGSQIVANGKLITSRYIKKIPNMNWRQYEYKFCDTCNTLNIEIFTDRDSSKLTECKGCSNSLDTKGKKVFLIPEFGFEADGNNIKNPGLKKPERTYKGQAAYVGYRREIAFTDYQIGTGFFQIGMSERDEMAILNESKFFVCEDCGYTLLDEKLYSITTRKKHKKPSGFNCPNDRLMRFSLGYRFETDVVRIRFLDPDLTEKDVALSLLYGVLRGISNTLNIEENDISGCLHYFYNPTLSRPNYELVLYDRTPGGAGHVRRINDAKIFENVLKKTLEIIENCSCGGEDKDSSCYSCLRGYYNQRHHDNLKRKYVIDFLNKI